MAFNGKLWEGLGENVGSHFLGREEVDFDIAVLNLLPDPLHLDVDVLHLAVMLRVFENFDG